MSGTSPKEDALADVRDALASLNSVPAVALDTNKLELVRCARDDVASLERALVNEVDQQTEENRRSR